MPDMFRGRLQAFRGSLQPCVAAFRRPHDSLRPHFTYIVECGGLATLLVACGHHTSRDIGHSCFSTCVGPDGMSIKSQVPTVCNLPLFVSSAHLPSLTSTVPAAHVPVSASPAPSDWCVMMFCLLSAHIKPLTSVVFCVAVDQPLQMQRHIEVCPSVVSAQMAVKRTKTWWQTR